MFHFLKSFGLGLLYVILSPLLLVILVLVSLEGFLIYLIEGSKAIGRFFKGKKLFPPFEEDILAKQIMDQKMGLQKVETAPAVPPTTNVYVQQNYYQAPQSSGPSPLPGIPSSTAPGIPGTFSGPQDFIQQPPTTQVPYQQSPSLPQVQPVNNPVEIPFTYVDHKEEDK